MNNPRLDLEYMPDHVHKVKFSYWQKRHEYSNYVPWVVTYEGYTNGRCSIIIHHPNIHRGRVVYPKLTLETPEAFADFIVKMLGVYKNFGRYIHISAADVRELQDAYKEEVRKAKNSRSVFV